MINAHKSPTVQICDGCGTKTQHFAVVLDHGEVIVKICRSCAVQATKLLEAVL